MKISPYLHFDGRCDEAIEFYQQALGARLQFVFRFKQNPEPQYNPPGMDEKIMHANLLIGETQVMVSDGRCTGDAKFEGITLSIEVADAAEADRTYNALLEGGKVTMPLAQTFFSPRFGMVVDKFGVHWMIIVPQPMA